MGRLFSVAVPFSSSAPPLLNFLNQGIHRFWKSPFSKMGSSRFSAKMGTQMMFGTIKAVVVLLPGFQKGRDIKAS
jgi:hypothetical protein